MAVAIDGRVELRPGLLDDGPRGLEICQRGDEGLIGNGDLIFERV